MKRSFLLSITLLLFCTFAAAQINLNFGSDSPMRKMQMAEIAISNFYVDDVDEQKVVEDAIRGMLKGLDPHSTYTDAKETKAMNEPLQGDFEGIGVQFNMIEDTLVVIQPVVNGPSEKSWYYCRRPHCYGRRYVNSGRKNESCRYYEAFTR